MTSAARVLVLGPSGRMGRAVIEAAQGRTDVRVVATADEKDDPAPGLDACDVYVDFTTPAATAQIAALARARGKAAVIGTTGLTPAADAALVELSKVAPVVVAANFSVGVNLLAGLVKQVAATLGTEWDAEVVETHHRAKRDAPSGTALMIARAIAAGHGSDYDAVKRHTRDGDIGPRPQGQIGVSTMRGGDVVGEHTASFFGPAERIEITHRAGSRSIFAAGSLRAAAWVVGKKPGRYTMQHVLGFADP